MKERSCIQKRALSLFTEVQTSCAGDTYGPLETSFTIWLAEQTSVLTAVVVNTSVDASGADRSMTKVLQME